MWMASLNRLWRRTDIDKLQCSASSARSCRVSMQSNLMLLIAAAIWGFGFVAQRLGMNFLEPFAFNSARFLLGSLSLVPLLWFISRKPKESELVTGDAAKNPLTKAGIITGLILFIAATLQQYGLFYTSAAKAGFITG